MLSFRRTLVASAVSLAVVAVLAGCAGSSVSSTPLSFAQIRSAGAQIGASAAVTSTSTPGTSTQQQGQSGSTSTGWSDSTGCPQALVSGEQAVMGASVKFTVLDPSTTFGLLTDSGLNPGMHPSCAFSLATSSKSEIEEIFINMPQSYLATFASKMEADGFTLNTTASNADNDSMVKGSVADVLSYFPTSSQSPYSYVIAIG